MQVLQSAVLFSLSILVTVYSIQKTILVSTTKKLLDFPSEDRKVHTVETPNLGGVGIFFSLVITVALFFLPGSIPDIKFLLASAVLIFLIGLKDDLIGTNPYKKFIGQAIAAAIIIVFTDYRITSFSGVLGIYEIPELISIPFSILFVLLLINAFNLIDGINCLASGIALLCGIIFCILFRETGQDGFFNLSLALCGSLIAFIYYNRTPAKIFLGDSGSLFIGLLLSVFAMAFLQSGVSTAASKILPAQLPGTAIIFSIFIIPVFDTLRVFLLRIIKGKSPFVADKNHLHHLLLDLRFSHIEATTILVCINALLVILAIYVSAAMRLDFFILFTFIFLVAFCKILQVIAERKYTIPPASIPTYADQKVKPIIRIFEQLFRA